MNEGIYIYTVDESKRWTVSRIAIPNVFKYTEKYIFNEEKENKDKEVSITTVDPIKKINNYLTVPRQMLTITQQNPKIRTEILYKQAKILERRDYIFISSIEENKEDKEYTIFVKSNYRGGFLKERIQYFPNSDTIHIHELYDQESKDITCVSVFSSSGTVIEFGSFKNGNPYREHNIYDENGKVIKSLYYTESNCYSKINLI